MAVVTGARPPVDVQAQAWTRRSDVQAAKKNEPYTARLTLNVAPNVCARIKIRGVEHGMTVAELLRQVLERHVSRDVS